MEKKIKIRLESNIFKKIIILFKILEHVPKFSETKFLARLGTFVIRNLGWLIHIYSLNINRYQDFSKL